MKTTFFNKALQILAVFLFSLILGHFVGHLTASPFSFSDWPMVLLWNLVFISLFELIKRFTKSSMLILLFSLLVGFVFRQKIVDFLYSPLANEISSSVLWGLMLPGHKFVMPEIYPLLYIIVLAYVSVLFLYILPIKLLSVVLIVLPLFFIENLESIQWFWPLLIALSCVLVFYQKRLNLLLLSTIMIFVVIFSQVFTPADFFYRPLNLLLSEKKFNFSDQIFSLRQVGYDTGDAKIGGPVEIDNSPFMKVESVYQPFNLKGSIYTEFVNDTWKAPTINKVVELNREDLSFQTEVFKPFTHELAEKIKITITPIVKPMRTLFYSDILVVIEADSLITVYFDEYGMVHSFPSNSESYDVVSTLGYNLLIRDPDLELTRSTPPQYQFRDSLSLNKADELYHLVYEAFDQHPTVNNLREIINYFKTEYTYETNVPYPTLSSKQPGYSPALAQFFIDKEGYCVYYATALTLFLQDLGFEARYVEGFVVPFGKNVTVTNKNAHAWVELNVDGYWIELDATPSEHLSTLVYPEDANNPSNDSNNIIEPEIPEIPEIPDLEPGITEPDIIEPEIPDTTPTPPTQIETKQTNYTFWIISLSFIGFVLIQQYRFKNRHNPHHLSNRLKNNEKETVKLIYKDIQRLYKINYQETLPLNFVYPTLYQIATKANIYDQHQLPYAARAINDALYSLELSHPLSINGLVNFYFRLEKSTQVKTNSVIYFVRRVLFYFH